MELGCAIPGLNALAMDAERATMAAYEEFGPALLGYAGQIAGSTEEARDAVQEVFLRYLVERRYGRPVPNPRAWLYHVMRHYLLDRIKAAPARREIGTADIDALFGHQETNPEELVRRRQAARAIQQALSRREFTCLALRGEGLSYAEIARAMAIRTGTVGALLARAQNKLRDYGSHDDGCNYRDIGQALLCLVEQEMACSRS